MRALLINSNRMQPPIGPIGLDYVAEAMSAAGHSVQLLDLCWEEDAHAALSVFLRKNEFGLIGVTLRNTDDCAFSSRQSFLPGFAEIIEIIRSNAEAPVVIGGVGFSVMPELVISETGADFGIWGEGEFVLPELAHRLENKKEWRELPGLIWRNGCALHRNSPIARTLADLPRMGRSWVDNRRYFLQGGQAGFETKRGCSGKCIYCADPVAKGAKVRRRPPAAVADELEALLEQGIDTLHTCDGEFNIPGVHALDICGEITRRGLGGRLRWYAYCAPVPYSRELAQAMRTAGCVGINFGVDNGNEEMLKRLGRNFGPIDIRNAARWTKEQGMSVMFDLLLGAPGETEESIRQTVELVKQAEPDCAGISLGVRVYPGVELARQTSSGQIGGLIGGENPFDPLFYLEPKIAASVFGWLDTLVGNDRRFFFFDPSRPNQNYNYNANQRLVEAIQQGHRGAFWDILRKL
jgi:tryptophan 2-C-methyltransferase